MSPLKSWWRRAKECSQLFFVAAQLDEQGYSP